MILLSPRGPLTEAGWDLLGWLPLVVLQPPHLVLELIPAPPHFYFSLHQRFCPPDVQPLAPLLRARDLSPWVWGFCSNPHGDPTILLPVLF